MDLQAERVLVVDDNRDAADSLGMMLGAFGAEVRVAYDGQGALRISELFRPNLVFLDIGMPGMDGFEVARRFRDLKMGACRLVAVTGWGQEADRQRTASSGFDHHLTKPVEMNTLVGLFAERKPPRLTAPKTNGRKISGEP